MLGQKFTEEQGRVTGRRVLEGDDFRYVKMEVSFEAQGNVLGIPATDIGTYTVFARVGDQIYGQGQGIIMTNAGESAIWNGHGVGRMEGSSMVFAFSVAYQAAEGKLAPLNSFLGVGEHRADMDGSIKSTAWEWKA